MIKEDLIAERIAIETYRETLRYFGDRDPTSRVVLERTWRRRKSTPTTCTTCWSVAAGFLGSLRCAWDGVTG